MADVLVTARNHVWIAEVSGKPLSEVHRLYEEALEAEEICTIEVPDAIVFNVFEKKEETPDDSTGTDVPGHRRGTRS